MKFALHAYNMSTEEIIEYVKNYADRAHGQQLRKYTGERYIVHPVRVLEMTRRYNADICIQVACLLHDVLEDTPVTADELRDALLQVLDKPEAARVVSLVIELTDIYVKEHYSGLNRRTRKDKEAARLAGVSPEAQTIKYADIIDNVTDIVNEDSDFAQVYVREAKKFLQLMVAGNVQLREKAVQLIDQCLEHLPDTFPTSKVSSSF
jgi:(p)ppGpp synthase/HD superfamily hydrolase